MSSANPSKRSPSRVSKRIAPTARRVSYERSTYGARYHATTVMPRAWAARRKRAVRAGRKTAGPGRLLADWRKRIVTPLRSIRRTVASGFAQAARSKMSIHDPSPP
jgi:hypothetical protein